ncbi:uromodulin-like [Embiotoca jacksoni]|uniref:uromodulin-like n=1 Tax=Embiotoca jacksoni TaxID=100190 RepID=UPI0037043DEE
MTLNQKGTLVTGCDACHDEATCLESQERGDSFASQAVSCVCKDGFVGDGITCYDTKLCSDSSCCSHGYQWAPDSGCVDTDECSIPDSPCKTPKICRNTPGSYDCLEPAAASRTRSGQPSQSVQYNCELTVCPLGMDCIHFNGTARCADPCENYTALHDDWRSINNRQILNKCDRTRSWQGWYRLFLQRASAHIPDRCIPDSRCGTASTLWVKEPNPTQSHEIVNRTVCNSWVGNCCFSNPYTIQVKRCYGNFYVYKLVAPTSCNHAYCAEEDRADPGVSSTTSSPRTQDMTETTTADSSTAVEGQVRLANGGNSSCSGRVEVYHAGQWGTVCDDVWDLNDANVVCRQLGCGRARSAPSNAAFGQGRGPIWMDNVSCSGRESSITDCRHSGFGVHNCVHGEDASAVCEFQHPPFLPFTLVCGREKLGIGLQLAGMASTGLNPFSGNLAVRNCSWVRVHDDTVWYEADAQTGSCGNTLTTNRTHAIYSNSLFIYPVDNSSSTLPTSLPFSCVYPLDTDTRLNVAIRPSLSLTDGISGSGTRARASMSLFRTSNYTETYPAGRVTLPVGSPLYVSVSVEDTDPSFAVVLENCFASHSSNPNDPDRYPLIQNKCPADRRQVSLAESGSSLRARFSALFFLLQGEYRDVYLHCSLGLCNRRTSYCVPQCTSRTSRSVSNSASVTPITVGPIIWDKSAE